MTFVDDKLLLNRKRENQNLFHLCHRIQKPLIWILALYLWNYASCHVTHKGIHERLYSRFVRRIKLSKNNMAAVFSISRSDQIFFMHFIVCLCFEFWFRNLNAENRVFFSFDSTIRALNDIKAIVLVRFNSVSVKIAFNNVGENCLKHVQNTKLLNQVNEKISLLLLCVSRELTSHTHTIKSPTFFFQILLPLLFLESFSK